MSVSTPSSEQDRAAPPGSGNLQPRLTSFVGRGQDMAEIARLLTSNRLVTLAGVGGVGKTRLGLEVARRIAGRFRHGVWVVELASLTEAGQVEQAVGQLFGLHQEGRRGPAQALAEHLKGRQLLLLLDNCEHLVDACAELSEALLRACPDLKILTTSREGLHAAGETVFQVPCLALPTESDMQNLDTLARVEAVQLLLTRAASLQPDFKLSRRNAAAVASICRQLDGIPLAIELAAGKLGVMTAEEVAARLQGRFLFLRGGKRTAVPRHQTLAAALDWSYGLLTEQEQKLLRRLSVFASGWTLEAAEAVVAGDGVSAGDATEALAGLANKSLVVVERPTDEQPEKSRYRLLETVRSYAAERLAEDPEDDARTQERHSEYYLSFMAERSERFKREDQAGTFAEVARDLDNVRKAWRLAAARGNLAALERAADTLWLFYATGGDLYVEAEALFRLIVETVETSGAADRPRSLLLGKALQGQGAALFRLGAFEQAREALTASVDLFRRWDDRVKLALSLNLLAAAVQLQGKYQEVSALLADSLRLVEETGDGWLAGYSLNDLGMARFRLGDGSEAERLSSMALARFKERDDRRGVAFALHNLGVYRLNDRAHAGAQRLLEESLALRRSLGDRWGVASSLVQLGAARRAEGDGQASKRHLVDALRLAHDIRALPVALEALVELACGQADKAEKGWAVELVLKATEHPACDHATREKAQAHLQRLQTALPPAEIAKAHESVAQIDFDSVVEAMLSGRIWHERSGQARSPASGRKAQRDELSRRERQVLRLLAAGKSNLEIASELSLSVRTVERHITTIYEKIGTGGKVARATATAYAFKHGLT